VVVPGVHSALGDGLKLGLGEVFGFEDGAVAAFIRAVLFQG